MEKRRYARKAIDIPVSYVVKGGSGTARGTGRDISIGGIFIESETQAAFGAEVIITVELRSATGGMTTFALPGRVRWVRSDGMGVQFGLLGAHETHAITELTRDE